MRRNIRVKLAALMAFTSVLGNKTLGMGSNNYFGNSKGMFYTGQKTDEWQNLSKESKYVIVGSGVVLLLLLGVGAFYLINNKDTKSKIIKNDFCDIQLKERSIKDKGKKYKEISDDQLVEITRIVFEKTKEILISYKENNLLGKLYHFFVNNISLEYRVKNLGTPDEKKKQEDIQKQNEGKLIWVNGLGGEAIKNKFYIANNENCFLKDIATCLNNKEIMKNLVINAEVDYYSGAVDLKFSFKLGDVECRFNWPGPSLLYIDFKNNKIKSVSDGGLFVGFEYKNSPFESSKNLFELEEVKK
ncbi:MAG: hypothetical protein J6P21_01835 [Clostridia bacterium]|nr:hypothetical protein [Clostridia bacterium]